MMNITFIFPDWVDPEATIEHDKKGLGIGHFNFAIATLSAILKQHGYTTRLIRICYEPQEDEFKKLLQEYTTTSLFAFSFTEVEVEWVKKMNRWIKEELGTYTAGGGMYPTLEPENALMNLGLDAVCVGEGDAALLNLCKCIETKEQPYGIRNIWARTSDDIIKNPVGEIALDLNNLPRYDDDLFDPKKLKNFASNLPRLFYLCSRNCAFSCSFCANHAKREALQAAGCYVRRFSPNRVIKDIKYYVQKYPFIKVVHFADEVIHHDKAWFRELMVKYKSEIGLPWRSYAMLKLLDKETIELMAWSGCTRVNCGIEAGSERIRQIYNRPQISNDEIIEKISMLKNAGIDVHTSTLLNAPTETVAEMIQTIKLVAKANTDIAVTGIIVPYKGTKIYKFAHDEGLLGKTAFENSGVSIKPADCSVGKVVFLYHAYRLLVETYKVIFSMSGIHSKILELALDCIVRSKLIPHNFLVLLRKRFFEGKILNWAYRKAESKLGRIEIAPDELSTMVTLVSEQRS